jgi:hypothetical protein
MPRAQPWAAAPQPLKPLWLVFLSYNDGAGHVVKETTTTTLVAGWNLLKRTVNGVTSTFLVYGT